MIQNLIVGIFMILALSFIIATIYIFTAKPTDVRMALTSKGVFIEVKRWFIWDSLETKEEVNEYYDGVIMEYPFLNGDDAAEVLRGIKKNLGKE